MASDLSSVPLLISFAATRWTAASEQFLNIPLNKDREACYSMEPHSIGRPPRPPRPFNPLIIPVRMRKSHTRLRRPTGPSPN